MPERESERRGDERDRARRELNKQQAPAAALQVERLLAFFFFLVWNFAKSFFFTFFFRLLRFPQETSTPRCRSALERAATALLPATRPLPEARISHHSSRKQDGARRKAKRRKAEMSRPPRSSLGIRLRLALLLLLSLSLAFAVPSLAQAPSPSPAPRAQQPSSPEEAVPPQGGPVAVAPAVTTTNRGATTTPLPATPPTPP